MRDAQAVSGAVFEGQRGFLCLVYESSGLQLAVVWALVVEGWLKAAPPAAGNSAQMDEPVKQSQPLWFCSGFVSFEIIDKLQPSTLSLLTFVQVSTSWQNTIARNSLRQGDQARLPRRQDPSGRQINQCDLSAASSSIHPSFWRGFRPSPSSTPAREACHDGGACVQSECLTRPPLSVGA